VFKVAGLISPSHSGQPRHGCGSGVNFLQKLKAQYVIVIAVGKRISHLGKGGIQPLLSSTAQATITSSCVAQIPSYLETIQHIHVRVFDEYEKQLQEISLMINQTALLRYRQ
jgi:hypothetical protein